jgi:hypothetical protein
MGRWKKSISIREAIGEGDSEAGIISAAEAIHALLSDTDAPVEGLMEARDMAKTDTDAALEMFNDTLKEIYDWADENGVWLG